MKFEFLTRETNNAKCARVDGVMRLRSRCQGYIEGRDCHCFRVFKASVVVDDSGLNDDL